MKIQIYNVLRKTAGGLHSWCDSNVGMIRKPNNSLPKFESESESEKVLTLVWWQRLWNWFKSLIKK